MEYLIGFLITLAVVGIVSLFWMDREGDRRYQKEQKKRLDDDRVYDPETGSFYTFEELERGIAHQEKDPDEPFTEEEITAGYYDYDAFPRTHNYVINQGYRSSYPEFFLAALFHSTLYNYFNYCTALRSYGISERSLLLLLQCHHEVVLAGAGDIYFTGVVRLKNNSGHYVLRETNARSTLSKLIDRKTNYITHNGWTINCLEGEENESLFEKVIHCFPKNEKDDLDLLDASVGLSATVEIKGEYLIFMSNNPIHPDRVGSVLMTLSNLEREFR